MSNNFVVDSSFEKTINVTHQFRNIMCCVSGGSDSDIVIDLLEKSGCSANYVYYDTGLEYDATKEHIKQLERKYQIQIKTLKPKIPIPLACKKYGLPFLSKEISDKINRLQRHNFKFEDKPFDELYKEYPKCKAALRWWCNDFGEKSRYNIEYTKGLKEFLISKPPTFRISDKCCNCAKKSIGKQYAKENDIDLTILGLRKYEGGARNRLKRCFIAENDKSYFYPIFWYKKLDKQYYESKYNIEHSKCYSVYGLERTGCAGCPFGKDYKNELEIMKRFEPKLYKAAINIFKDSYEYTDQFYNFRKNLLTNSI